MDDASVGYSVVGHSSILLVLAPVFFFSKAALICKFTLQSDQVFCDLSDVLCKLTGFGAIKSINQSTTGHKV